VDRHQTIGLTDSSMAPLLAERQFLTEAAIPCLGLAELTTPANLVQMPPQQNDKSNLNIERTQFSDQVVLIVSGRMDAENATQFQEKCGDCISEGHTSLVADLGELAYVSSMGLRSFLSVAKTLQSKGGALRLCCLKGLVKQVFEITGLLQVFPVYESVESAVLEAKR
jgi:anti-anti-sigma factor